MAKIESTINNIFGVRDCKVMFFGATLIDTDVSSGISPDLLGNAKREFEWSPRNALMLYPEVESIEKDENDAKNEKKPNLALASSWINGFIPFVRGLPDATNMSRTTSNFLEGRSVPTTDQVLKARNDGTLASLLHHFKWYTSNEPIIDKSLATQDGIDRITRKGLVCDNWSKNPISIRYVVKIDQENDKTYDYVYLIGGSQDIIGDNLDGVSLSISQMYEQIKNLKEDAKKEKKPNKGSSNTSYCADPKNIWLSYNDDGKDSLIKANLLAKKMLRTIQGIFFIRNYLVYAKKHLAVVTIDEVGYDPIKKEKTVKKVEIENIIKKYDRIYAYCKNLCYIYSDIAKGDVI